jgi:hypothetical protein
MRHGVQKIPLRSQGAWIRQQHTKRWKLFVCSPPEGFWFVHAKEEYYRGQQIALIRINNSGPCTNE